MLLARLVAGRYGYETAEDQPRKALPASQGWVSRLVAAILIRRKIVS